MLGLGVAAQLAALMTSPFAMYVERPLPKDHPGFVPWLMVAAVAAALSVLGAKWLRGLALAVLVVANIALGIVTFRASPDPAIDVVTVHRAAFDALEDGKSPYSITFPDIYKGSESFYPPGSVEGGVVQFGYTYPFGTLLMAWPGQVLAGDFRYAELAALTFGAVAIAYAGRLTAVAVLAVALLLFTPRVFFELEQAWNEPLAIPWLGVALLAWRAGWIRTAMIAMALLVSVKQYLVVAVPLSLLLPAVGSRQSAVEGGQWAVSTWIERLRMPIAVGLIAIAFYLPPLVWDFQGFVRSVLMVQVNENLRLDSLSLAVNYWQLKGREMSTLLYGSIVLAALALTLWRAPRTPAGYAAALALVLFTAFAFGKKAFCNYYFFVIATLCAAVACGEGEHASHEDTKITKER
jgi:hypothetical protein